MKSNQEIAENYIKRAIGGDFAIDQDSIEDLSDFYAFTYQSRKYLETGNFLDMAIGQGYIFLHKSDNRFFSFRSAQDFEDSLVELRYQILKEGEIQKSFPHFDIQKQYDIRVTEVVNKDVLIDVLIQNKTTYIVPDIVGNSIFRIAKIYEKKSLAERLSLLPTTFHGVNQMVLPSVVQYFIETNCCQFDLVESIKKECATYTDNATPEDLDPIW